MHGWSALAVALQHLSVLSSYPAVVLPMAAVAALTLGGPLQCRFQPTQPRSALSHQLRTHIHGRYPKNSSGLVLTLVRTDFIAIAMSAVPQAAAHRKQRTSLMPHCPMLISSSCGSSLAECFRFTNLPEAQLNTSIPDVCVPQVAI